METVVEEEQEEGREAPLMIAVKRVHGFDHRIGRVYEFEQEQTNDLDSQLHNAPSETKNSSRMFQQLILRVGSRVCTLISVIQ